MVARKTTEEVIVEKAFVALVLSKLLKRCFEAVQFVVIEKAQQLGVEARDNIVPHDNVNESWGARLVGEAEYLVAVLVRFVV